MTILIKQNTHIPKKNNKKTLEIMVKLKNVVKKEREKNDKDHAIIWSIPPIRVTYDDQNVAVVDDKDPSAVMTVIKLKSWLWCCGTTRNNDNTDWDAEK